jgi:hypothetical protein
MRVPYVRVWRAVAANMAGVDILRRGGLEAANMIGRNTAFLSIRTPKEMKAGGWEMQNIGVGLNTT